ncbi:MAG: tetratricopeptide repeat protein [Polaribacter sp.]
MNCQKKKKEERKKRKDTRCKMLFRNYSSSLFSFLFYLFSIFSLLCPTNTFSQDSIPLAKDVTEEKELKFQQYFFKALSEKSILNYQKAIQNLETCNQILPNNVAVFFEFSKNYLSLNNTLEAKEYITRALEKDAENIWMLKHLVAIYKKDKNFAEAIKIQQKVIQQNPKEKQHLVRLHLQNRDYKSAMDLMNLLEKETGLSKNLKQLKQSLEKRKERLFVDNKKDDITSLIHQFKSDKSYTILKQILKKSQNNSAQLLTYSSEGIALFPAQPYVYLMNGKALNYQKSYKKALSILENGIDFVIEDAIEADFYKEMANAYKGLGNLKEEKKYREKYKKLKS